LCEQAENQFTDNGAFQFFGSGVEQIIAGNVGRRMGGFVGWGQWYGNQTVGCTKDCVTSIGPDMRQLWLDNEVLDENGVRNYMSNAKHTLEGARLRNATTAEGVAQQNVKTPPSTSLITQ
jgi:hypothetical protein